MALILNIDTSVEGASLCLAENDNIIEVAETPDSRSHSGWLHPTMQRSMQDNKISFKELDAIAVTIGPGSYTGLRVGLSAAKGLCYALSKPLIAIGTLDLMANTLTKKSNAWICPMIDARRMEVFTALYDEQLNIVEAPAALVLNENSFDVHLQHHQIVFTGNGAVKMKQLITSNNASFDYTKVNAANMVSLSHQFYQEKKFSDLAYIEPLYIKEFYFATAHQ